MSKLLLLCLAGGLGSLSRYTLAGIVQRLVGAGFPFGTFVVNILGCFLFGFIWGYLEDRLTLPPDTRTIVLTGFMGAFTTFSTFIFESVNLLAASQVMYAIANIAGQVLVGIILVWLGLHLGKMI